MATLRPSSTARVRLPSVDDETGWYRFVHGRLPPSEKDRNDMVAQCRAASHIPPSIDDSGSIDMDTTVSTSDSEDEVDGLLPSYKGPEDLFASWDYVFSTPTMAMLGTLDSTEALTLTKYFRKWIQHPHFTEYRMQVHSMHEVHAQWLFALLARIDQHLISDDIATLRVLARACMKNIVRTRTASHMHVPASDGALSAESGAWMILVLLAGVWGQWDLWDETQARLQCVEERK
ncbi:SMN complex protein [Malassezia pachydermatis]